MPMPFLKAVTTEKGVELLNRSQAGEGSITFFAIATGSGVYSNMEKNPEILKKTTNLKASKNFYKISEVRKEGANSVKVTAVIGNQDPVTKEAVVTEGYNINEIGLFAKIEGDSENTLLSIAVTSGEQGDYLPAFTGKETAQIIQNYIVSISNDLEISLKYSDAAVAFKSDVDKQLADFKAQVSAEQAELNKSLAKAIKDIADSKGASTTTFNADGSIVTENSLETVTTTFNKADKSILEKHAYKNGTIKTLKTVFEGEKIITTEVK